MLPPRPTYYCSICGYTLSAHRRAPHHRGKAHLTNLTGRWEQTTKLVEQLRKDKDYVQIDQGHFLVRLANKTEVRVVAVALDDLGNRTVVLQSNLGFRQYLHNEVVEVVSMSKIHYPC
jgi:hypothetical protein